MSTSRIPRPGQRQADYANIGYAGRKTGVVLKDNGARDEHGMPNIDDLFSSPPQPGTTSKNAVQLNGISKALAGAEPDHIIDLQQDAPIYSSPRKALLPRARSPIKTSIGSPRKSLNGSPTKTMALRASPVRIRAHSPVFHSDVARTNRESFISNKHKRRSLEQAPKRPPVAAPLMDEPRARQSSRTSVSENPSSPAVFQRLEGHINGTSTRAPAAKMAKENLLPNATRTRLSSSSRGEGSRYISKQHQEDNNVNGLFVEQESDAAVEPGNEEFSIAELPQKLKKPAKSGGKRRLNDIEATERAQLPQLEVPSQFDDDFQADIGGFDEVADDFSPEVELPMTLGQGIEVQNESDTEQQQDDSTRPYLTLSRPSHKVPQAKGSVANHKKRPSPHKDVEDEASPPAKKVRPSVQQTMPPPTKSVSHPANQQVIAKPAPTHGTTRNRKQQASLEDETQSAPSPPPLLRKARPKGRGLQIVRDTVENEVDGARYTRSGRTSVKPVEYWRGERIIYTEPRREGGRVSLPGIKNVIRIEDEPQTTRPTKKRKPGKTYRRQASVESQGEPEQQWEIEPGVFAGEVSSWDPEKQQGDSEFLEQVDIALAPSGLEALTREVPDASFQFAKTITLPFFHSGMVDIPPGGEKKQKPSRRYHMVFWVFSGRVIVHVSGNEFSLGKGGMWQVPRGNDYSVNNPYEKPARLFFAQGCYMTEAEGEALEDDEAVGTTQD